jgi:hypothetical protein
MESKEGSIKGKDFISSELIYDELEFSIQRQLDFLKTLILFSVLMTLNIISNAYNNFHFPLDENPNNLKFLMYYGASIIIVLCCLFAIYPFLIYRKRNDRVYDYNEIKCVEVLRKNNIVKILFTFSDNTKDVIKLPNNKKAIEFIDILKSKNTEFKNS